MDCENQFCMYQTDGKCMFNEISINSIGMCEGDTYINISDELLNKIKTENLMDIMQRD